MSTGKHILMISFVLILSSVFIIEGYLSHSWDYNEGIYYVSDSTFLYNLGAPDKQFDLPSELEEISALTMYSKTELACVQDEKGILYFYNLRKKDITRKMEFGNKGDYEGVEIIEDTAYVLRSDGKIFSFRIEKREAGEVTKIHTDLTAENDAEGLGYDAELGELLIACKAKPGTDKADVKGKSVYSYKLGENKFKKKPRYNIDKKDYEAVLTSKDLSKKKHLPYKPSGIAVHPHTKNLYIIGSVGKMLTILSRDNEILDLVPLRPGIFRQPEGICFNSKGTLFIASEGAGGAGYILEFSSTQKPPGK